VEKHFESDPLVNPSHEYPRFDAPIREKNCSICGGEILWDYLVSQGMDQVS